MRHLINEGEGPDVYKQGESVCHVTSRDWDSLPILRGSFIFFTSLLMWACFTTKATNLLLVAHFDAVHDVQSNHHRGAPHERVNA